MLQVRTGVRPEEVSQSAQHVLFVEGADQDALDPLVLRELLENRIRIEPLGPSFHIRSVADALYAYHPSYYFLVDRDHHTDTFVQNCWQQFPDPDTSNLLVWPRRELESYFLIPEFLLRSEYANCKEEVLRQRILDCCQQRLYLDAANQALTETREALREKWIEQFDRVADFPTKEAALTQLLNAPEFPSQKRKVSRKLSKKQLTAQFERALTRLTGDTEPLAFGAGRWLELIRAKKILPTIVSQCFRVEDAQGRRVQGADAVREVARSLVALPRDQHPADFRRLYEVVVQRVEAG